MDLLSKVRGLLSRLKPKKAVVSTEHEPKIYSSIVQHKVDKIGKQVGQLQNEIEEIYAKRGDLRKEKKFEEAMELGRQITKKHQMMDALQSDAEDLMNQDRKNL